MDEFLLRLSESTVYLIGDKELISLWEDAHTRKRVISGIKGREEAEKTKKFEYDGTAKSYRDNLFKSVSHRDQRSIIRNEKKDKINALKGKNTEVLASRKETLKSAPQVTDMRYRTIGKNTNPIYTMHGPDGSKQQFHIKTINSKPQDTHEEKHVEQGNLYRRTYGKQDLIRMQNDYEKKSLKGISKGNTTNYMKDSLEASANRAALGHHDDHKTMSKILSNAHKGHFATTDAKTGANLNAKIAEKSGVHLVPIDHNSGRFGGKQISEKDVPKSIRDKFKK